MLPGTKIVLTDFDGVFADSFATLSGLAAEHCRLMTPEIYRARFNGNIMNQSAADIPGDHSQCRHATVDEWYEESTKRFENVRAFEGIPEAFRTISETYTISLVTSGDTSFIVPFLERNGIPDVIAEIYDHRTHTSKVEKMRMVMEKHRVSPAECVFITDTLGDIREAEEHGIDVIGCSWGFHSHEALSQGIPFRIVDAPRELPDAVDDYFNSYARA